MPLNKQEDFLGLLLVDKPPHITSHDLVKQIRRLARQKTVGHIGTLDPLATGLMGILLGRATKLEPYLVGLSKTYLGKMLLGLETNTNDVLGLITKENNVNFENKDSYLNSFSAMIGELSQVPPQFSAIKIKGRPAYKMARQGEIVKLKARAVTAKNLKIMGQAFQNISFFKELNEQDFNFTNKTFLELEFLAEVSSGFYVRSLVRDFGEKISTGATLSALQRTAVGAFNLQQAHNVEDIEAWTLEDWQNNLIKPEKALNHLETIVFNNEEIQKIQFGQRIDFIEDKRLKNIKLNVPYKAVSENNILVAMVEFYNKIKTDLNRNPLGPYLRPLRVIYTKPLGKE